MNLGVVDQQDHLFARYELLSGMNMLKNDAIIDMYIGPRGFCPIRPANSTRIRIDYQSGPGDLPKVHGPNETVSEVIVGGMGQRSIEAPYWRGKFSIDEYTITEMRKVGEAPTSPGRVGYQAIKDRVTWARRTTDARMAQTACQALYGSVTLNYEDGAQRTLDYAHSPQLRIDLTTDSNREVWTNHDAAKPIDDIRELKHRLRKFGAMDPYYLLMGGNVYGNLLQCEQYKDYVKQTGEGVKITANMELPTPTFCDLVPMVAKGTYPIIDRIVADVANNATVVTLMNGAKGTFGQLVSGDEVVFRLSSSSSNEEAEVLAKVSSISGDQLTLDGEIGKAFVSGDQVVWNRPYIGWNDVFILPMSNPGEWMQWAVAQSTHARMRSQRYAVIDRVMPSIPEKYEIIYGVDGIPVFISKNQHGFLRVAAIGD